jgi:nicotinamide-nucleotide amidase
MSAGETATVRIVAVGDELLEGRTSDTNSTRIQRALAGHAVDVRDIAVVHDQLADIAAALERTEAGDLVFVCGGLGSTRDDLTREAVAAWATVDLQWRDDVAAALADEYRRRGFERDLTTDKQPLIPAGCEAIANPVGTAPGILGLLRERWLVVMPGVPSELQAMLPAMVAGLAAAGALPPARPTRLWRVAQMAEIAVAELTEPVRQRYPDLHWSWWVVPWGVDVRLGAGPDQAAQLTAASRDLDVVLGDLAYAHELVDLPRVVQDLMLRAGRSLAVAESCTGGLLGGAITGQDGSSAYFRGGVLSYSNEAKFDLLHVSADALLAHGAVSRQVAEQMASGARERLGADHALAITGVSGPGGGTPTKPVGTTWVGLAGPGGVEAACFRFSGDRERNRTLAVAAALDMLRRSLMGAPVVDPARSSWLVRR